jgi:hypothetical protein
MISINTIIRATEVSKCFGLKVSITMIEVSFNKIFSYASHLEKNLSHRCFYLYGDYFHHVFN